MMQNKLRYKTFTSISIHPWDKRDQEAVDLGIRLKTIQCSPWHSSWRRIIGTVYFNLNNLFCQNNYADILSNIGIYYLIIYGYYLI